MAKKRQLNVRLPDALLSQLEERVLATKMGMAAMVEVLLVQALQMQEATENTVVPSDRFESLVKRVEALEAKFLVQPESLTSDALPTTSTSPDLEKQQPSNFTALKTEDLATRLTVEVRMLHQKKDKSTFSNWSKKHDPEGIAWKYVVPEDCFYPISN